ncbi:ribosome biogenesis GTP-binding protein YihA/YsxC [Fundicoccus ignavus]|mgnify:CR=1 FL=1|uniref:Probable GTP-binding protein EngB n=1 Tax=Fundicoccus ignavus TaxID=2664442 RepID=A0A6I2GHQ9_9LACT|nr:ribosome biogenesis GTP-binding protein YihA/YsxC [Fundicoccus ignavus]MRI80575.1 YihA family ribosome biogenesis GTP-binding protein [Fundicoccus ignavus]MRI84809.1 YihA family ribosome biogenesis GTP-binding protein [Fundicoccus ignavus]MRJ46563.1 YihA family ribosome biogenesis GTP-binding protein [Fundicoccus ignavus]
MQVNHAELVISAVRPNQYPEDSVPEIALAGRSNVGKSSFINRMIERIGLARTSSQPGKTQTLNFYNINNEFRFVDVPGYGYARVSKSERIKWGSMIEHYILNRENIRLLLLLMDIRHEPTELDIAMKEFADEAEIPYAIVLTKLDKIKKSQLNKHLSIYKKSLNLPTVDALFYFSSETGEGSEDIWDIIEDQLAE